MFDTMTLTKVGGAFCGAFLVFLLGGWAAETIYFGGPGGHGDEAASYVIEVAAAEPEVADEGPAFADLYAVADVAAGEKAFNACKACHNLQGKNGTGPYLNGVIGRTAGAVEGYVYSAAMVAHGGAWEPETIASFIANPKVYVDGTKMSYAGMKKPQDRANLVAYLATLN